MLAPPPQSPAPAPLVLNAGAVVRGRTITNPEGPCIVVAERATDVRIEASQIGPCGGGVDGIGIELRPGARRITVAGNAIHDVASGLYAVDARNPITFTGNAVWNVRGPMPRGQMLQFDHVNGPGHTLIAGNVSDRWAATVPTRYEDHINMYRSSGTRGAPIEIACNQIRGGDSQTGSAIMLGDHGGGWFSAHDNTVVLTTNAGIGVAGAHDVRIAGNRIFNDGATVASLTDTAVSVFRYAGNVPRNVALIGNRGIARNWINGGEGQLGPGLWTDGRTQRLIRRGNTWRDRSLSAEIWRSHVPGCDDPPPIGPDPPGGPVRFVP